MPLVLALGHIIPSSNRAHGWDNVDQQIPLVVMHRLPP